MAIFSAALTLARRLSALAESRFDIAHRICRGYRLSMDNNAVLVTTMNDVPGFKIVAVYGEVFGLICRARNAFSNMGAGLRTLFGGEVAGYTQLLSDSREQAIGRLRLAAMEKGGNAVVAMRFDCNEIGNIMSEIAAYGTAVRIEKL
ncbi:MAG TPA: heavy metal-binding domain-containing protein [Candidatus Binataceae bacterium]|nr:heavy metal-binding domain-containing protein [Candidatus Binataceae bacterium]